MAIDRCCHADGNKCFFTYESSFKSCSDGPRSFTKIKLESRLTQSLFRRDVNIMFIVLKHPLIQQRLCRQQNIKFRHDIVYTGTSIFDKISETTTHLINVDTKSLFTAVPGVVTL